MNILLEAFVRNLVSLIRLRLQILGKTQTGVFPISGFLVNPLLKENCHKSRTGNDIDMKLGPVTKLDKRNKITSKKIDSDVMSAISDVIVIFPYYDQFGPTWKPDSGSLVCKTYIFINSKILSYKNWKQN